MIGKQKKKGCKWKETDGSRCSYKLGPFCCCQTQKIILYNADTRENKHIQWTVTTFELIN